MIIELEPVLGELEANHALIRTNLEKNKYMKMMKRRPAKFKKGVSSTVFIHLPYVIVKDLTFFKANWLE